MKRVFAFLGVFLSYVVWGQDNTVYAGMTKDGQEIYYFELEDAYMVSLYTYKKENTEKYRLDHKSLLGYKCAKNKEHEHRTFYTVFYKNGKVVDFIDDSTHKKKFLGIYPNTINESLAKCICELNCSTNNKLDKDEMPDFFRELKNVAEAIKNN